MNSINYCNHELDLDQCIFICNKCKKVIGINDFADSCIEQKFLIDSEDIDSENKFRKKNKTMKDNYKINGNSPCVDVTISDKNLELIREILNDYFIHDDKSIRYSINDYVVQAYVYSLQNYPDTSFSEYLYTIFNQDTLNQTIILYRVFVSILILFSIKNIDCNLDIYKLIKILSSRGDPYIDFSSVLNKIFNDFNFSNILYSKLDLPLKFQWQFIKNYYNSKIVYRHEQFLMKFLDKLNFPYFLKPHILELYRNCMSNVLLDGRGPKMAMAVIVFHSIYNKCKFIKDKIESENEKKIYDEFVLSACKEEDKYTKDIISYFLLTNTESETLYESKRKTLIHSHSKYYKVHNCNNE